MVISRQPINTKIWIAAAAVIVIIIAVSYLAASNRGLYRLLGASGPAEPTGACYRHDVDVPCKDGVTEAQCDSRTKEQRDQGVLRSDYWVKGTKCDPTLELVPEGVSYEMCMKGEKLAEAEMTCFTKLERERQAQEKLCKLGQEFKVFYKGMIIDTSYDPLEDECYVTCSLVGKCVDKPRLPLTAPAPNSSPSPSPTIKM